jgi:hypothetical protein
MNAVHDDIRNLLLHTLVAHTRDIAIILLNQMRVAFKTTVSKNIMSYRDCTHTTVKA